MALRLYLDDCAFSRLLRDLLRQAGHTVVVPADVGLVGEDDHIHLAHAAQSGLVLLTKDPDDFLVLHEDYRTRGQHHPGIFGVYQDNDAHRDMSDAEITRAIGNVESIQLPIADQFIVLNHYRW